MRIRVRNGHWIPRLLKVEGIVLYPYVLFARREISPVLLAHEMVHVRQVRARGWLAFYGGYLREYLRGRLSGQSHDAAYRAISFEDEAYRTQGLIALTEAEQRELGLAQMAARQPAP